MKALVILSVVAMNYVFINHAMAKHNSVHHEITKPDYYYFKRDSQYCREIKNGWILNDCQDSPYEEKPKEEDYNNDLSGNNYYGR